MKNSLPKLELITASVMFGTIGVFRKAIPLNSGMISMFRGFIGAAILLLVLLFKKKKPDFKAIRENIVKLCVSGAAIGINWILCFEAYNYTSIAVSTLCYYMAPIFIIIASVLILKEHITIKSIFCIAVALIGMVLVSGAWNSTSNPKQYIGILLSLGAAVLYATDVMCNKTMKNINALNRTIVQMLVAGIVTAPYVIFVEEPVEFELTFKIVAFVAILGIFHTGLSFALYFDSLSKLNTQTVAFFTYIDPVLAVLLSALFLKEPMTIYVGIGAICIIGSALYNELQSN